jgi:hypothetical protein
MSFRSPGRTPSAATWRFGALRSGGRTHEGFDIVAACRTPLLAVATGRVQAQPVAFERRSSSAT